MNNQPTTARLRARWGLTASDIGQIVGPVSPSRVRAWEAGEAAPSYEISRRLLALDRLMDRLDDYEATPTPRRKKKLSELLRKTLDLALARAVSWATKSRTRGGTR